MQVADDAPGARQALGSVEEGRGEVRPGGRRRLQARQQGAVFGEQFGDGGSRAKGWSSSWFFKKTKGAARALHRWGWKTFSQAACR